MVFVNALGAQELSPSESLADLIGQKAYGLACLPHAWSLPFFVVDIAGAVPTDRLLACAARAAFLDTDAKVIVRSSCRTETIETRGQMGDSISCMWQNVQISLEQLRKSLPTNELPLVVIVQAYKTAVAKGHLSNERRIAKVARDWRFEQEATSTSIADKQPIAIRPWRNKEDRSAAAMLGKAAQSIPKLLRSVALWASLQNVRVHFEWVWDGHCVYIVQADDASLHGSGESPKALVADFVPVTVDASRLRYWRIAQVREYATYRKLQNAALYQRLSYQLPAFFILDDEEVMRLATLENGVLPEQLLQDLAALTRRPLVIRTDGTGIPDDLRQMLPRSDELRSMEDAKKWLSEKLGPKLRETLARIPQHSLQEVRFVLLAHHFLPATASAWAKATPGTPRVRIEALWGIPEGLYWYAHDVHDVDTMLPRAIGADRPKNMDIRVRHRYKSKFVAPAADGRWIVHKSDAKHDWSSVLRAEEAKQIAWTTRRIAEELGESVIVMWFVDPAPGSVNHRVLPWYHEPAPKILSPRVVSEQHFLGDVALVETKKDWATIKARVHHIPRRLRIEPKEPELVRDRAFAEDVAAFAKAHGVTIELAGGVLSHVYYVLTSQGSNVECIDLDDFVDETTPTEFNKLVRDLIPASITQRGETVNIVKLKGEALLKQVRSKLIEEAFEVADARTIAHVVEELADLEEVADALRQTLGISKRRIADTRRRKKRNRGGFEEGIMLRTASAPSPLTPPPIDDIFTGTISAARDIKVESDPNTLPTASLSLHVDRRTSATGEETRQLTAIFGVDLVNELRASSAFELATSSGANVPILAELTVDRERGRLRVRVVLRRAPDQLALDIESHDDLH